MLTPFQTFIKNTKKNKAVGRKGLAPTALVCNLVLLRPMSFLLIFFFTFYYTVNIYDNG